MIPHPLQTASTNTPETVLAILLFLGLFVTVVVSAIILWRGVRRYWQDRNVALLGLSVGIAFTTGIPIVANMGLSTAANLETAAITVFTNCLRLLGLGLLLVVIYGSRGDRR
ncbi:hypothetical protein [Halorientalis halophila]|uniref:hypothetical protein n=1 Tax=Halorientalis halophila TaxID=3108499 RepID=UPI00300A16F2